MPELLLQKKKFTFSISFVLFPLLTPCFFCHLLFSFPSLSFLVSRLRRKKVVLNIDVPLLTEDASSAEDRYSTVCETSLLHALVCASSVSKKSKLDIRGWFACRPSRLYGRLCGRLISQFEKKSSLFPNFSKGLVLPRGEPLFKVIHPRISFLSFLFPIFIFPLLKESYAS